MGGRIYCNVHSILENVLENTRGAGRELVYIALVNIFEVAGVDLFVFPGEDIVLVFLTFQEDLLDKTKCFLEAITNLGSNAHASGDVFVFSGLEPKFVRVPGEEFIVVTGEHSGFGLCEFTTKKFIVVGKFPAGKMSERLYELGHIGDIRINLIPADRGESGGSNKSSNKDGSSEFNHCELFIWG